MSTAGGDEQLPSKVDTEDGSQKQSQESIYSQEERLSGSKNTKERERMLSEGPSSPDSFKQRSSRPPSEPGGKSKAKLSAAEKQRLYRERKQDKIEQDKKELQDLRARNLKLELENEHLKRQQEQLKRELEQSRQQAAGIPWAMYGPPFPSGMHIRPTIPLMPPPGGMPLFYHPGGGGFLMHPPHPGSLIPGHPGTPQQAPDIHGEGRPSGQQTPDSPPHRTKRIRGHAPESPEAPPSVHSGPLQHPSSFGPPVGYSPSGQPYGMQPHHSQTEQWHDSSPASQPPVILGQAMMVPHPGLAAGGHVRHRRTSQAVAQGDAERERERERGAVGEEEKEESPQRQPGRSEAGSRRQSLADRPAPLPQGQLRAQQLHGVRAWGEEQEGGRDRERQRRVSGAAAAVAAGGDGGAQGGPGEEDRRVKEEIRAELQGYGMIHGENPRFLWRPHQP